MKRKVVLLAIPLMLVCCGMAGAQAIISDGEFDTRSWDVWEQVVGHNGGQFVNFTTDGVNNSMCYKKPSALGGGNGSIVQQVDLIAGVTYDFFANIAASKPC